MIKLFGNSATNWIYPTWADFVCMHYDVDCKIYGKPGTGNQTIKKLLLYTANQGDVCIAMLGEIDRLEVGVDREFYKANSKFNLRHPVMDSLWGHNFQHGDLQFVPLKHDSNNFKADFSLFHALYTQAELLVDMQNHAEAENFTLRFLNWQHIHGDPTTRKQNNGVALPVDISRYRENKMFDKIYSKVNFTMMLDDKFTGLKNFKEEGLNQFLFFKSEWDQHPSSLTHFLYFQKYVKPYLDSKYSAKNNLDVLHSLAEKFSQFVSTGDSQQYPFYVNGNRELVHDRFNEVRERILRDWFTDFASKLNDCHMYDITNTDIGD